MVFPPGTSTQFACEATPVPRLKPIQKLASFVPATASLAHFGEFFPWLMYERLPSVCFVMFWVDGLLVTYQLTDAAAPVVVSQTRVVPSTRWPQPVVAPAGWQASPPGIPPRKMSIGWVNERGSPPPPPVIAV